MENNRPLLDRRTIVAMLLAFGVMQAWFWYTGSAKKPEAADTDASAPPVAAAPASAPPATPPAPPAEVKKLPFKVCNTEAQVTTEGGALQSMRLMDYKADYVVTPVWTWLLHQVIGPRGGWVPYDLAVGPAQMVTEDGQFFALGTGSVESPATRLTVTAATADKIDLAGTTADGLTVARTIAARPDCTVDISTSWTNAGATPYHGVAWIAVHDAFGGTVASAGRSVVRPVAVLSKRQTWDIVEGPPAEVGGPVSVLGVGDHYFAAVAHAAEPDQAVLFTNERKAGDKVLHGVTATFSQGIGPGETLTRHHRLYAGPQLADKMSAVNPEVARVIDSGWFGWFAFFGAPVLWVLKHLFAWTNSWGVGIILLTVFFKTLFYPLTASAFRSGLKMQAVQPKLAALREELKDNPEELNRRTMALFSQHGVNPLGGCAPSLAQVPVWMALGSVLTFSVELYHSSFLVWKDLAASDPYAVLPVSVVVLQLLLQRLMPTAPGMDPAQARMMQLMPVFLAFLYFNLPAGLMIYIFCNLLLTIVQQLLMRRIYQPPVLPA
jgi:YidC/Oxa1 family membrane protein insertase